MVKEIRGDIRERSSYYGSDKAGEGQWKGPPAESERHSKGNYRERAEHLGEKGIQIVAMY